MPWVPSEELASYLRSGVADWVGEWVTCRIGHLVIFTVVWSADAGTAFTLSLQGRDRRAGDASIVTIPTVAGGAGVYGDWPTVGAVAGVGVLVVRAPMNQLRVRGVGAGGVADQFTIYTELRGS